MCRIVVLVVTALLLSLQSLLAQDKLNGAVVDTAGAALPGAAVLLINPADSSVVGYGVTDNRGTFSLSTSRRGKHWLQARVVGYLVENRSVVLPAAGEVRFVLRIDPKEIEAVRIKGTMRGFKERGDTLVYDPKAFATGMEKTLGDLLAKLPGLQVSADGEVTAQGKKVDKILFGGRDLFGSDVSLATKSVSADVADSVRVIHGYSEYNVLDGFQSHDKTVLDVGVNESMWNKLTGEVRAAGGYKCVYDGKAQAMYLGKQFMVNMQAAANNTGTSLFSFSDYMAMQGGAQRIDGGYSITIRSDDALYKLINPPSDTYKRRTELGMLHMSYSKDKLFKLNFGLVGTGFKSQSQSRIERLFSTGLLAGRNRTSLVDGTDRTGLFFGTLSATYTPSDRATLLFSCKSDYSQSDARSAALELFGNDTLAESSTYAKRPLNLSTALSGAFRLGDHLLTVGTSYDRTSAASERDFVSDSLTLPLVLQPTGGRFLYGQRGRETNDAVRADATMKFRLTESQFISVGMYDAISIATLRRDAMPELALRPGAALFSDSWRMGSQLTRNDLALLLSWARNKGLFQFTLGVEGHYYQAWHNLPSHLDDVRKFAVLPSAELKLHFASMNDLTLRYNERISSNELENFVPGYELLSPSTLAQRGFATRLYGRMRSVSLDYNLFHTPTSFFFYGGVQSQWETSLDKVYDRYGLASVSHAINGATSRSTSAILMVSKTVASFWKLSGSATWRNSDSYYYVATDKLPYRQHGVSGKASVNTTYKAVLNGHASGSITSTYYSLSDSPWRRALGWRTLAGVDLKYKSFEAMAEGGYDAAPGNFSAARRALLNAEVSYHFPYNLTLSAIGRNLLSMSKNRYSSEEMNALYLERRLYGTMPGYAMLQLRWKFGGKKKGDDFNIEVLQY